jgi:hypothetical protein
MRSLKEADLEATNLPLQSQILLVRVRRVPTPLFINRPKSLRHTRNVYSDQPTICVSVTQHTQCETVLHHE